MKLEQLGRILRKLDLDMTVSGSVRGLKSACVGVGWGGGGLLCQVMQCHNL